MNQSGLAVLGTGTGVGKTVVTAGLVGWLRERNRSAVGIKPAQTGFPPDDDATFVKKAAGEESAGVCLHRLEPALAPAIAAGEEGVDLSYEEVLRGCERELARADPGIVEGIGGLRVPLADGQEVVDLIADLGLPAVVVARSGLGTLNHSALTVEALERRGITVSGIILNDFAGATLAERTNPDALTEMVHTPVHVLPTFGFESPAGVVHPIRNHLPLSILPGEEDVGQEYSS